MNTIFTESFYTLIVHTIRILLAIDLNTKYERNNF